MRVLNQQHMVSEVTEDSVGKSLVDDSMMVYFRNLENIYEVGSWAKTDQLMTKNWNIPSP